MSGFNRLLKNSLANIINGFSNVILGIVISPFLINILSLDEFSVWSICLQAGIAVSIFGVAGQITIGRFTSQFKFNNDERGLNHVINNYFNITLYIFIFFLLVLSVVLINFESIFTSIPNEIIFESKIAFLLVFGTFSLGIFATVFIGYFIGIEKNHVTANINLISRVFIGITVVSLADYGLIAIASSYFVINVFSYLFMYKQFRAFEKHHFSFGFQGKIDELIKFFGGLTIWNIAQFLISGIGIFVVSIYDFENLPYFVLAMTMMNAIVGLLGAIVNPIIQPIVKLNEADNKKGVDELVISLSMIFSLTIFLGVNISSYISLPILQLWVGDSNGELANNYFNYLLVAFAIRMVIAPYGMKLVANAQQLKIAHFPVFEGVLNFLLSMLLVKEFGAIGIAYSTILSALVIMLVYTIKYSKETILDKSALIIFLSFLLIPSIAVISIFSFDYVSDANRIYLQLAQVVVFIATGFYLSKCFVKVKGIVNETKAIS
ncbi:lipopolysaccharide biosynthesis protein [Shewanella sp. SR44-3]|uniref:lipopolysaccharide biosynthesis protein n=1 Tax=Shewanella sp. SR44-3 TaxID=2760936 RepID=UPI0015FBD31A|nr:flippase [Shewanella sp. SR44-3]MBB1269288.1 flippase [Shewanella sp. SR44-3]